MIELLAATTLLTATQDARCPMRVAHQVAFTSEEATDLFVAALSRPCSSEQARVSMTLYGSDGEVLHEFEVDTGCAMNTTDLANRTRAALARYAPTRAEEMKPVSELDEYNWADDLELYARARSEGGPLVCANTMPFGGECIWYDSANQRAVTVLYYGS